MGKLQEFGAVSTKVRAMQSRLLGEEDYRKMAGEKTFAGALGVLAEYPAYQNAIHEIPPDRADRMSIEEAIRKSEYADFLKLYRFSGIREKAFLRLYASRYEAQVLKRCLRHAVSGEEILARISCPESVFAIASKTDLDRLIAARTPEEFLDAADGSPCGPAFRKLRAEGNTRIADYESAVDLTRFRLLWDSRKNGLVKEDAAILREIIGSEIDIQNIIWILRMRKYYSMGPEEIRGRLIPIHWKLRPVLRDRLISAPDMETFREAIAHSPYAKLLPIREKREISLEEMKNRAFAAVYGGSVRKNYYSIACLAAYLFRKERELENIITVLERIRYGKGGTGS
jgi:V/A-type H+-transporting ATPase subunit C